MLAGAGEAGASVVDTTDFVQFTGSTATGRAVAIRCAEHLKPVSLELGGRDPAIVLEDADLARAVEGSRGAVCSTQGRSASPSSGYTW